MPSTVKPCVKDKSVVEFDHARASSVGGLPFNKKKPSLWKILMTGWHLDKKVPIALLGMILLQTFGMGWWAANVEARVTKTEKGLDQLESYQKQTIDLLARLDERLKTQADTLSSIERKMQ